MTTSSTKPVCFSTHRTPRLLTWGLLVTVATLVGCATNGQPSKENAGNPGAGAASDATARDWEQDAQPQRPPTGVQATMRAKLAHANAVLEALALEDFKQVKTNAEALNRLSQATDFQVHRNLPYIRLAADFRSISSEMADHAKDKNIHAVTLDYMRMTMTCVKCHSYLRHEGLAAGDAASDWFALAE